MTMNEHTVLKNNWKRLQIYTAMYNIIKLYDLETTLNVIKTFKHNLNLKQLYLENVKLEWEITAWT